MNTLINLDDYRSHRTRALARADPCLSVSEALNDVAGLIDDAFASTRSPAAAEALVEAERILRGVRLALGDHAI